MTRPRVAEVNPATGTFAPRAGAPSMDRTVASAPLIVGTGTNNTRSTIAATQSLAGIPAVVGALVVVPYYVRPSEAAIV